MRHMLAMGSQEFNVIELLMVSLETAPGPLSGSIRQ